MKALDFIKAHNEVIFWNIYRFNEDNARWDIIDPAEIEEDEMVDGVFFDSIFNENDECDLYLFW